jgi:mercuric ion transport protein
MNDSSPSPAPLPALVAYRRIARRAAVMATALLAIALLWQVVSAGAAVFVNPVWWAWHLATVHWFDWLSVAIVVLAFVGRMSRGFKVLSGTSVFLILLQYATAGIRTAPVFGVLAALHPLSGFLLFWALTELLRRGVRELKA